VKLALVTAITGNCLASVVFGIGNDLFGTEVVDSNEPIWNQEANLLVNT